MIIKEASTEYFSQTDDEIFPLKNVVNKDRDKNGHDWREGTGVQARFCVQ